MTHITLLLQSPFIMNMPQFPLSPSFDTAAFMRNDWRKRPVLIRNAFDFSAGAPVTPAQVQAFAVLPDVTSKIIAHKDGKWSLKRCPLTTLPKTTVPNWTVLVQNVELLSTAANELLRQFKFARFAELDDLMISYATTGGGVGPHIDSYDVFLIQAHGQRRWRISQQTDLSLVPKLPLKILQNFAPQQEWVVNPGDMLYLPPNVAHDGVALGECLTYSVGYRAPQMHDVLDDLLGMMSPEDGDDDSPQLKLPANTTAPAQLTEQDVSSYRQALTDWLNDAVLEEHLGCVLTRPNRAHAVAAPKAKLKAADLHLPAGTRMLYSTGFVFIEGFAFAAQGQDYTVLTQLANQRHLPAAQLALLSSDAKAVLQDWLQEGWCVQ